MKRILFLIFLALFLQNIVLANSLQVEKIIDKSDIKTGDNVTILLKFTNPFGKKIPIKIVDKNIFGNNGLDIKCFEYILPEKRETTVAYEPIKPFKAGEYTISPAQINYTNPETGKKETIKSNSLHVSVKDSGIKGQIQGITSIYRCNGVNMQSTTYSSSGSFTMQVGSNIQQSNQQTNQRGQTIQNKIENNQLNQNTNAIKQQMEKQIREQKQMEESFRKNIESNPEFLKKHEKLLNSGYQLKNSSFNPKSNNTGTFEYTYQKQNGETAEIKGEMENGTMKKLMSLTQEEKNAILDKLRKNKKFKELNEKLLKQGFNQSKIEFKQITENQTKVTVNYQNNLGENKNITADYIKDEIKNVNLEEKKEKKERNDLWILLLIAVIGLVCLIYKKYFKKTEEVVLELPEKKTRSVDYKKEVKRMISEAEELFKNKKEKDAYEKVSQALRFYFSNKLKINAEVTNTELLEVLKKRKSKDYKKIKNCLNLCTLVEFAKYKANKKDFNKIISIVKDIVRV